MSAQGDDYRFMHSNSFVILRGKESPNKYYTTTIVILPNFSQLFQIFLILCKKRMDLLHFLRFINDIITF
jgi:hypothetical protein